MQVEPNNGQRTTVYIYCSFQLLTSASTYIHLHKILHNDMLQAFVPYITSTFKIRQPSLKHSIKQNSNSYVIYPISHVT